MKQKKIKKKYHYLNQDVRKRLNEMSDAIKKSNPWYIAIIIIIFKKSKIKI